MIVRFHHRKKYDECFYECEMESPPRAGDLISIGAFAGEVKEVWWLIDDEPVVAVIVQDDDIYPPSLD